MKKMAGGVLFCVVALAMSVIYGQEEGSGVYGVDVFVKQNPSKRAATDPRGKFTLDALPAGTVTLRFRARKAGDFRDNTSDKVTVAKTYSIKIEGAKRAVNKAGLTSDDLVAGYDINIDLAAGAKVRGEVAAGAVKKMVWIAKEPGTNIPGRWVEADSPEAQAAAYRNALKMTPEELRLMQR